tara:strand:- start:396 stop:596 length:201 start_codon:yes stop_codon:yes gene_type:complete
MTTKKEKPGYKTTEFYLSLGAMVVGALVASDVFSEGSTGMKIAALVSSALVAMGYTGARMQIKKDG